MMSLICRMFRRWRDPDSNRGHHDFQSWATPPRSEKNPQQIRASFPDQNAALCCRLRLVDAPFGSQQVPRDPMASGLDRIRTLDELSAQADALGLTGADAEAFVETEHDDDLRGHDVRAIDDLRNTIGGRR